MTYNELSIITNFAKTRLLDKLDKKILHKLIEVDSIIHSYGPEDFKEIINKCNDTIQMYFIMRAPTLYQYINHPSENVSILAVTLDGNNIFHVKKKNDLLKEIAEKKHNIKLEEVSE
jgi:acetylglutamate synthase